MVYYFKKQVPRAPAIVNIRTYILYIPFTLCLFYYKNSLSCWFFLFLLYVYILNSHARNFLITSTWLFFREEEKVKSQVDTKGQNGEIYILY